MLGVLEAETGQVAECATLAASVFSQPGLAGWQSRRRGLPARRADAALLDVVFAAFDAGGPGGDFIFDEGDFALEMGRAGLVRFLLRPSSRGAEAHGYARAVTPRLLKR